MSSRCYSCAYYHSGICKITGSFPYTGNDCGNYVPEIVVKVEHHERKKDDYLPNVVVELRTTKRALWLSRAKEASRMKHEYKVMSDFGLWKKWDCVERKCREKAEEYK